MKKEGSGTVPARKLLEFVRLLPEGDVNMKFLENHWASITCGRSRTRHFPASSRERPERKRHLRLTVSGIGGTTGVRASALRR